MADMLVVHPADMAQLRRLFDRELGVPAPRTLFGVQVVENEAVPAGTILRARLPKHDDRPRFELDPIAPMLQMRFGAAPIQPRSLFLTMCEGAPMKQLTKAQRRRKAKRFVREEIARRRMAMHAERKAS